MIKKIECYVAMCDICGKSVDDEAEFRVHYDTEQEALDAALDPDMHDCCQEINGKLCCSKCWFWDDDDEPAIRGEQ